MSLSTELQLLALAIGLHVFDSVLLLYPNEGALTLIGNGKWRVLMVLTIQMHESLTWVRAS
jgi:hypothetical protein